MFERTENTFMAQRTWKGYVIKRMAKTNHIKEKVIVKCFAGPMKEWHIIPDVTYPIIKMYRTGNRAVLQTHKKDYVTEIHRKRRDRNYMRWSIKYHILESEKNK